jgi:hypothetical protein
MTTVSLTENPQPRIDVEQAVRTLHRFSHRTTDEADLVAELNERLDAVARLQADLADGIFDDGDADQLHGGIAYEQHHIDQIVTELERRERARAFGYRGSRMPAEPDLSERFARIRTGGADELADLIGLETSQPGHKTGQRWRFVCPFHDDTTPSFVVYPNGRGYCFGCGWNGDAVDFVAQRRGTSLVSALRLLEQGLV